MFFHFSQNNSGGGFELDKDRGITHNVIVEAADADQANLKAESIGLYFDGCSTGMDCPCCGDRWSAAYSEEADEEPCVYGTPVGVEPKWKPMKWMEEGYETCVHYANGEIRWFA